MPFLRFKGFAKNLLVTISPIVVEEISRIAEVSREKVKMELLQVEQITESPRSVEILIFEREQKKHDEIAAMLHHLLSSHGITDTHIFFILLSPSLYYKEGLPLKKPQLTAAT